MTPRIVLLLILHCFSFLTPLHAADKANYSVKPRTHHGQKWRIGYLEGGPYINYPLHLKAIVSSLAEMGWVEKVEHIPQDDPNDSAAMWRWIGQNVKSSYITFVPDAHWSANWDAKELRPKNRAAVLKRMNVQNDIDLMLAAGTWAGQDLATNEHHVPTIVISTSDPIGAKIIKSAEDSGFDHLNARVDPTRYERQIRVFHDIFGFTRLGIVYTDTVDGRAFAALADVRKIAKEKHFDIVSAHAPFADVTQEEAFQAVLKCHRELAPKVDAFFLTVHRGVDDKRLPELLAPFFAHKVPVFSQSGSEHVRLGVLLSMAQAGFKYVAKFHAQTIAKIFNGAKPRDLDQLFLDPPRIAINTRSAEIIAYDPPLEILNMADEIY